MKRERVGNIRVCGISRGTAYPSINGWTTIPAWSRGAQPYCQLSPFFIRDEKDCIFENIWQSYKVWETVYEQKSWEWKWPEEKHVGEDGLPNELWTKWHDALIHNKYAVRRPNGRHIPLYAWFNGEKLDIIRARQEIYIPMLQKLYRKHSTYQKLLEMVKSGEDIIIVEPDGPPKHLFPEGLEVNIELLKQLQLVTKVGEIPGLRSAPGISQKYVPYGHGYVIALTILEDI